MHNPEQINYVRYDNSLIDSICPNCKLYKLEFTGGDYRLTYRQDDKLALPRYKCSFCSYSTTVDILYANVFSTERELDIYTKAHPIDAIYFARELELELSYL